MTAIVDFCCILFYTGSFTTSLVAANAILLLANGCCGTIGTLRMELIAVLCSVTWVSIILIVYIFLILATFFVAEDTGYQLVVLMIPTILDVCFLFAIMPFFCKMFSWYDLSLKRSK